MTAHHGAWCARLGKTSAQEISANAAIGRKIRIVLFTRSRFARASPLRKTTRVSTRLNYGRLAKYQFAGPHGRASPPDRGGMLEEMAQGA